MPETAVEERQDAIKWLNALVKAGMRLPRQLYLVAGLTDEHGGCWGWIDQWGAKCFSNWGDRARIVPLFQAPAQRDFVDFGYFLRGYISGDLQQSPAAGGQFDVVCHSMGGLDTFACLVSDAWQPDRAPPPLTAPAFNYITLDTPFRGFINYDVRMQMSDVKNFPDRVTQTQALGPGSPLLARLIADRVNLSNRAERITCYSAELSTAIEVAASSSDLCSDCAPHVTPWAGPPGYMGQSIPAVSHSGPAGITASEITIAHVFNQILFNVD